MATLKENGFEEVKVIGRGQYGKAHLVKSDKDQSLVIAKTIDLTCLSTKERDSALQEVQLLRRLDHPNIVAYKDSFYMADTLVIIMQYCEGGDLATYIKDMARKKMRIREVQIMNYCVQVLQALQYIHSDRILHRDLKTSNLFLMKSKSVVKLGDFGISRVLEGSIEAAITVVGTPYYMSPEVCENKAYTYKSDIWSMGCVLYELCMLKHAFSADNLLGLVYKIVSDNYEPIPSQFYSQSLNALIQRMLEKNADKRPSVRDILLDDYVRSFMNEYVRTRGQCATPSTTSADREKAVVGTAGSRARSGGAGGRTGDTKSSSGCHPRASGDNVRNAGAGGSRGHTAGSDRAAAAPGDERQRAAHVRPSRDTASPATTETPKEAALRRKREAADRKAEELKVAAKQSVQTKMVARRMREVEFGQTRLGSLPPTSPVSADDALLHRSDGFTTGSGSSTPKEGLEPPLEEISEADSMGEEYEDDFEEDFCSEGSSVEEEPLMGDEGPAEERDFTRVMSNYEQDLLEPRNVSMKPALAPTATRSQKSGPIAGSGPAGVMDMRTRASKLRTELIQNMGEGAFQTAFDFLYQARTMNKDERSVRRELEALVGRENYKAYCFEVDQLVFQQMLYA